MRLGYEYQSLKDADIHPETRIFLNRFVPAIQRINSDKNLTVEQILATIEEIHGIIKNNDISITTCFYAPVDSVAGAEVEGAVVVVVVGLRIITSFLLWIFLQVKTTSLPFT